MPLFIAAAAALVVPMFMWGYVLKFRPQEVPDDLVVAARQNKREGFGPFGAFIDPLGRPFGPLILALIPPTARGRLRARIERAGRPGGLTLDGYARNKAGNLVVYGTAGVIGMLSGQLLVGIALLAVGVVQTDIVLWNLGRERQTEIQKALPDFLDVLTVTVSAGLGFRHALARVAESMPGPLSDEMLKALRQMELGTPLRDAFEELRQRNDSESLSNFVTAILQAEELGAPLASALAEISIDMRRDAFQHARRRAQRADPQVTIIVTFFMVPAMMLLIVAMLWYGTDGSFSRVFS
ncbi:type II secretion system F family protein [Actinomadura sp. HBU206391]|uniref:type II secretion system F family protein n=1 Tax=Actinomadura sp. HBU206391 TaxID=2731692 RepID=UPI0016508F72|nr:type II secretion system F family protein [Actinomadura sp. HBU206391]MBC6461868.1 type II secretion system F family protein [Actinomadura sp. HBU206391]